MKTVVAVLGIVGLCMMIGAVPSQAGCPVDGVFQSDWGEVQLSENGDQVTGTWRNGTVSGQRVGDVIHYTWTQGGTPMGRGYWQVSPDCARLSGPWGNGNSETGGGFWNLNR